MKQDTAHKNNLYIFLGSALGLGLSPILPGTCGGLVGVFVHLAAAYTLPPGVEIVVLVGVFILVAVLNHYLTPWAEAYWQEEDPRHFVLDEVCGYLVIPIFFRFGEPVLVALVGFVLFRIFDIFKLIPPAKQIDENFHGPWGILLDDVVSAGYAVLCLYILYSFYPSLITGNFA